MKRVLFYDSATGEILHAHYEVHVVEGRNGEGEQLSAPAADIADDARAELQSRGLDLDRLEQLTTGAALRSSTAVERAVDLTTGKLLSRRLTAAAGPRGEEGE